VRLDDEYRLEIKASGMKAAKKLADKGVLGRFGIDLISVKQEEVWRHLAIEINLRKGNTAQTSERCSRLELGEVQMIEVATQAEVGIRTIIGERCVGRDLDDGKGPQQIQIAFRHRMTWELRQRKSRPDEIGCLLHARQPPDAPAFDGNGRPEFCERGGLHALRPIEIDHGAAEQSRQMEDGGHRAS
jgi:hypothetical protein